MRRRVSLALGVAAIAAAVLLPGAMGGRTATPGVSAKLVTIGGTFPFSGPASSYAPIPVGMQAYFSYVNATVTKGKRGVFGRQIVFKTEDDGYNPALTVQKTKQLVEQDKVFALVGGLGTEPQEAVTAYLNQQKVPQIYVSTGATEWGADHAEHPYTIGWQPDYQAEAALYGRYIVKNLPNAKIGVIYQNDSYGKDYIAGLEAGLGSHKSQIVLTQGFEVTDTSVTTQVIALRRAGVDTLMIFGTPTPTIRTYATMAAIGWKPANIFVNSVSATDTFMGIAVARAGAAEVNGSLSTYYTKDPANPSWANDAGMKLYKQIMAKYAPAGARVTDGLYIYGMAKAYTFVQALRAAGANPTRASLLKAVFNMRDTTNPFLLPGVVTRTGAGDYFPISQQKLQRFTNGTWQPIGALVDTRPGR
ncbi:MAG TPA: ABC transporter substrate-binding protein [Gaiellaceae bacterium]|nr:ABC transporter substrate-binding protein [Gaiellaceae bacterium]